MSGLPQSPCHWCVDVNGDFTEVSDLLFSEETRRETLARVSNAAEWRHLQHLLVQVHYKGVTLSLAMDLIDVNDLPAVSPPASPSQSDADEEEDGRYFGEDWVLYGSYQPQEILQQVRSRESHQKWLELDNRIHQCYLEIKEALKDSAMYSQDHFDMQ